MWHLTDDHTGHALYNCLPLSEVCLIWRRKTRRPQESSELLQNIGGIVAVNLVLAASQDSAIDNLGVPPLTRSHAYAKDVM